MAESDIESLAKHLSRLPGLGRRSAQRAVLYLLTKGKNSLEPLANEMLRLAKEIKTCEKCGNLDMVSPCHVCTDHKRDKSMLCVVENVADLWALERNNVYKGVYFVLGGTLSAVDGMGPEELGISKLLAIIKNNDIQEVILATNATVEGQTTAHYITDCLSQSGIKVSKLAYGIPIGGELDYLDEGTLNAALSSRRAV